MRSKRKPMVQINVIPYIDVMLVLLVVFMITTPMLTQGVKVDLPQAKAKKIPPDAQGPIIVTVKKNAQLFLKMSEGDSSAHKVTRKTLKSRVKKARLQNDDRKVYIKGANQASYGNVVKTMVMLQQAGVTNVGLITEDKGEKE